jgi:hypothetical protein
VLPVPGIAEVRRYAEINKCQADEAYIRLHKQRERAIQKELTDPLRYGWEPPMWTVCDCLLGFPWVDADMARRVREAMGFKKPVQVLLINGGNRGGKSEYAAKRTVRQIVENPGWRAWALHEKEDQSIDWQHPLLWKYLPPEWRTTKKSSVMYMSYKEQTGFADGKFTCPNHANLRFFYYTMKIEGVEGGNLNWVWPDEKIPPDWVQTLELRIAEKGGRMVITFTPTDGYTQTVGMFQDGAETVLSSVGYVLPKDGKPPDVHQALGVSDEELREMELAKEENRAPQCVRARPENLIERILRGETKPKMPEGRNFELVPRVMRPSAVADPKGIRAVAFFHSSDNPYSTPMNVWNMMAGKPADHVRERFYGLGHKLLSARFPKFNVKVHVVSRERAAELAARGTRYHILDPANARNFCMLWGSRLPDSEKPRHVVYREWPGNYHIPGVGVPGPWAIPGDANHPDGKAGPAQRSFGFGYWRYKRELARLEGWESYEKGRGGGEGSSDVREEDWIIKLAEDGKAREMIFERIVDARFASNPKIENDRPSTLITDFADVGVTFKTAPGKSLADAVQAINDALDYDEERPVGYLNMADLVISEECINLIFALSTWTGADGAKGATKDLIDVLWMWLQSDPIYMDDQATGQVIGGGSY